MHYDAIIIDSLLSYQNIAFDFGIVNLRYNDEVMTLQKLMQHYYPEKNEAFTNSTLNLEECGKLNGILLYDYLTKLGFKCALISNLLENEEKLDSLLSQGTSAVIVSTTWTFGIQEVKKATDLIRAYDEKVPIIAGGVLLYNSYLIYKQRYNEDFDYNSTKDQFFFTNENHAFIEDINLFIVDRTGLQTLTKVLNAIKEKMHYDGISNTAYYRNGNLIFNHQQPEKIDLNNQVVSWNKVESEYLPQILPVQLSLGCSFECKFCNFFHKHQCYTKKIENIKKELNSIRSRPEVKMIRFVDDSMPPNVVQTLCEIMIEARIEIPWTTFVRLDALNEKNASLLKKTNCVDVQVGLESGDDRILKNMGKKASTDTYLRIFDYLSELDISIRGSFIVGYPGENQESITNTIEFINELPTNSDATIYVGFAPFILLPLAPIYLESARKPYKLRGYLIDWEHESMKFSDVPNYLKEVFLSVSNEILFAYPGDPLDINFSKNLSYKVKLARQRYQKGIVQGLQEKELNVMKSELKHALNRFQETIG
jgi:radical SAM superfamily enzyme YgiQ (UPF0313 family)